MFSETSAALEGARALLRGTIPYLDDDRFLAPEIGHAADLVRDGRLSAAAGIELLPRIAEA